MHKFKVLSTILLTSILALGISLITFAATLSNTTYTVKGGDCLSIIAQAHGESLINLRKSNNKWNDSIFPGQVLNILKTNDLAKDQVIQNNGASYKNYTVKGGDCLSVIAQAHGESLINLRKSNNKWNDLIFPGQVLNILKTNDLTKDQIVQNNGISYKNYTVKGGDCLSVIAQAHGESLINLRKSNNKWNDSIFPGQVLNVSVGITSTVRQPKNSVAITATVRQPIHLVATTYTSSDVNLLARLITAEAGGTSYNDQVSVGAVVLNRVKSGLFPNSIKAVIYQNSQFTPVTNGSINKTAQASAIKAAYSALKGTDPTNKALYFHNDNANNLIFQH